MKKNTQFCEFRRDSKIHLGSNIDGLRLAYPPYYGSCWRVARTGPLQYFSNNNLKKILLYLRNEVHLLRAFFHMIMFNVLARRQLYVNVNMPTLVRH